MKLNKCPECNGKLEEKKRKYLLLGVDLGTFPTLVCSSCKEQFYEDNILDEIDIAAKKKKLWGLEHRTKLNMLGSSLAVRLNKKQVEFSNLKKGEDVIVYPESKNRFVIEIPSFKENLKE